MTLKEFCLNVAKMYRDKNKFIIAEDLGPRGLCYIISRYFDYREICLRDVEIIKEKINKLPDFNPERWPNGWKWAINQTGFEPRAKFLEDFASTL